MIQSCIRRWVAPSALLLLVTVLSLPGCKGQQEVATRWTEQPIKIDGRSGDWPGVTGAVLKEQNAALSFCNDAERMYILFRTKDAGWARTIRMTGLTLYLDNRGGTNKDFYVCFKGGPSAEQVTGRREGSSGDRPEGDFQQPSGLDGARGRGPESREPSFTCYVKDRIAEKPIPMDGSEGPAVAFAMEQDFYTYEFSVPLAEGQVRQYGLNIAPGAPVGIGAVWGDMGDMARGERPSGGPGGGPGGGGMPPGGGGGMGGGPGGGGPGGGMGGPPGGGQRPNMPAKQEVWFKTILAMRAVTE